MPPSFLIFGILESIIFVSRQASKRFPNLVTAISTKDSYRRVLKRHMSTNHAIPGLRSRILRILKVRTPKDKTLSANLRELLPSSTMVEQVAIRLLHFSGLGDITNKHCGF